MYKTFIGVKIEDFNPLKGNQILFGERILKLDFNPYQDPNLCLAILEREDLRHELVKASTQVLLSYGPHDGTIVFTSAMVYQSNESLEDLMRSHPLPVFARSLCKYPSSVTPKEVLFPLFRSVDLGISYID
jgi:hypothetical protein